MKLAFCLFKYYAHGGLSRDLVRVVKLCQQRGHQVDIYTMEWNAPIPENFNVIILPAKGLTNHVRCRNFAQLFANTIKTKNYDATIGFNRMPGLDVYYICDICYKHSARKKHGAWFRLTPRYKTYAALETAVFAPQAATQILYKTAMLKQQYQSYYNTPDQRFHLIHPAVDISRKAQANAAAIRAKIRKAHNISPQQNLLLLIGSNFKLKGVDRALLALAALPKHILTNTSLWIVGSGNQEYYQKMAQKLGIANHIKFFGTVNNIPEILQAGDLALHPAYQDATGSTILEAVVAGLPIITTDTCGFAPHVITAKAGLVVTSPFKQETLNKYLLQALTDKDKLASWGKNALEYTKQNPWLFDNIDMVDAIEALAEKPVIPA